MNHHHTLPKQQQRLQLLWIQQKHDGSVKKANSCFSSSHAPVHRTIYETLEVATVSKIDFDLVAFDACCITRQCLRRGALSYRTIKL